MEKKENIIVPVDMERFYLSAFFTSFELKDVDGNKTKQYVDEYLKERKSRSCPINSPFEGETKRG